MKKILLFTSILAFSMGGLVLAEEATLSVEDVTGPNPKLVQPVKSLIPTVKIAKAIGWQNGEKPKAAKGFAINVFAKELDHPRWIYTLPNGDVLVAESNKPPKGEDGRSIKGFVQGKVMKRAGAGTESANRITLLRDADKDGVAEIKTVFLKDLYSPFGMALVGDNFYVANADAIVRFPYNQGETEIKATGIKVTDLPGGPRNHHWTKNIVASEDGKYLYVSVGSNSNVAENGMKEEEGRAAIWRVDLAKGSKELFATGLRNPVGMDFQPSSKELWTVVNERDELGSDLVPDYMTSVKENGFYGWPYSYWGQHVDERVEPQNPDLVAKAIKPDYALGPHTASLGLTFYDGKAFPKEYQNGAFIGQHGSWNRNPPSGYKVVFIAFKDGKPVGMPKDILTGFLDEEGNAQGRPVGVEINKNGDLLVADDVGNIIWRVTPSQ